MNYNYIKLYILFFVSNFIFGQEFDDLPKLYNEDNHLLFVTPTFGVGFSPYIYKVNTNFENLEGVAQVLSQYTIDFTLKADFGLLLMLDTRIFDKNDKLLMGFGAEYEWTSEPEVFSGVIRDFLRPEDTKTLNIRYFKYFFRTDYIIRENRDGIGIFGEGGLFKTYNDIGTGINDRFFVSAGGFVFWRIFQGVQIFMQVRADYTHYKSTITYDTDDVISTNHSMSIELGAGLRFGLFNNKIIW